MHARPINDKNLPLLITIGQVIGQDFSGLATEEGGAALGQTLRSFGFDSLALLELGIQLEDSLSITFNPAGFTLQPESTVGELLEAVEKQINPR